MPRDDASSSVSPTGQKLAKVSPKDLKARKAASSTKRGTWQKMNASDFIRSQPANTKASEVIEAGKRVGLKISSPLVYMVRSRMKAGSKASSATTTSKRGRGRPRKAAAVPVSPAKRGPGRPRKVDAVNGALTADEKTMASLILSVGLERTQALLDGLRRSLASLG